MLEISEGLGNENEISVGKNRVMYGSTMMYVVSEENNEKSMGMSTKESKRTLVSIKETKKTKKNE